MNRLAAYLAVLCLASCGGAGDSLKAAGPVEGKGPEPDIELEREYHMLEMYGDKEEVTGSCRLLVRREESRLVLEESCTRDAQAGTTTSTRWPSAAKAEAMLAICPPWAHSVGKRALASSHSLMTPEYRRPAMDRGYRYAPSPSQRPPCRCSTL